jgi:hypothetical protein
VATSFPENLDNFINPDSNTPLSNPSHSEQHQNANDAIEALQTKVGIDGSSNSNSLDYRVSQLETESGTLIAEQLGLSGNNDQTITGIENPTVIDTFDSSIWGTLEYKLQVEYQSYAVSSTVTAVNAGTSINVSEYAVVSNTDQSLYSLSFTSNGGNINLLVTPLVNPITVRFYRTALKK